ncbi:JAB domain-containing protein [Carnobacterium maltaromaticum]
MVAHNHPSTDITPSDADIEYKKRLKKVGELMYMQLRDHLIVPYKEASKK